MQILIIEMRHLLKKNICSVHIDPFLTNVTILYPLVFSAVIKWEHWPEMG